MRFIVTRTSDWSNRYNKRPCDEAFTEDGKTWYVNFSTIEQLMSFIQTHGECVIGGKNLDTPFIEIYDDYRE